MKSLFAICMLTIAGAVSAQTVTVSTFDSPLGGENYSTAGTWVGQVNVSGGILTVGPDSSTANGYFAFADLPSPFDATGLMLGSPVITALARIDADNAATGFFVNFFDADGVGVLTATFNISSFTTGSFTSAVAALTVHPEAGSLSNIVSFGIAGPGGSSAFRMSFDSLEVNASAIPEPSTYATIVGALAIGFVAYRRRQRAA